MIDLLYGLFDLLGTIIWVGSFALLGWWLWRMNKAMKPRKRTPREEAELAALRAMTDRDQDRLLSSLPPLDKRLPRG